MKSQIPLAARRDRIVHACSKNIEKSHRKIVVGLSGGADSCALLGCLCVLRDRGEIDEVAAIHVCHNLRSDCDVDASVSKIVSETLGCRFFHRDIYPRGHSGNVYEVSRMLRYETMSQVCREEGYSALAVAHHLNDQLETMIFKMCRGALPLSFCGMDLSRNLENGVPLIRPLLKSTREDCERMCSKMKINCIDDPSNLNFDRSRAFIRHKIVPLLRQLNPRIESSIGRLSETMRKQLQGEAHELSKEKEKCYFRIERSNCKGR